MNGDKLLILVKFIQTGSVAFPAAFLTSNKQANSNVQTAFICTNTPTAPSFLLVMMDHSCSLETQHSAWNDPFSDNIFSSCHCRLSLLIEMLRMLRYSLRWIISNFLASLLESKPDHICYGNDVSCLLLGSCTHTNSHLILTVTSSHSAPYLDNTYHWLYLVTFIY